VVPQSAKIKRRDTVERPCGYDVKVTTRFFYINKKRENGLKRGGLVVYSKMTPLIKKTESPFGIAVQALLFRRMERYSNMLTKNVFEELEYGSLTSNDLINLAKSVEDEDKTYFYAVCFYFYVALHNLNDDLIHTCAEKMWNKGGWKPRHLSKEEIDILAYGREATVKAVIYSNDEAVWERVEMPVEAERFKVYIEKVERDGGRDKHSSCVYDFLFGANERTLEVLKDHTNEIFSSMKLAESSVKNVE
jgi:hypothetical protein